jgi:integrase
VLDARPSIKPNSARAYATSLRLLAPPDATSLDFLLDTKAMIQKLDKYKHTTRRNYLNAIIVVLKGDEEQPEVNDAIQIYEKLRDEYNDEYSQQVGSHQKTDRQKEQWIEWNDYLDIVHALGKKTDALGTGEWNSREKMIYQDYLIALLYSKYPLRNDFAEVKVITKKTYNNLTKAEKEQRNYVVKHNSNKYFLVLNEYKTSKKYGEKKIEIDGDVLKPLRKWLRHSGSDYLLVNTKGDPLSSNGITKVLNRIGRAHRGKPFGSSLLRHSYLSHKYAKVDADKEKDADIMGHSLQMQSDYVKQ